jgi:hypothetical protein
MRTTLLYCNSDVGWVSDLERFDVAKFLGWEGFLNAATKDELCMALPRTRRPSDVRTYHLHHGVGMQSCRCHARLELQLQHPWSAWGRRGLRCVATN